MNTLQDIRTELSTREPQIVDAFNLATDREPWAALPEQERINFLRNLITPFAELALSDRPDARLCRRALHIAARHGERRHEQGLPDAILFQDLHFFRSAVCSQIGYDRYSAVYPEAISRIDKLLSLATSASLRGYYRDEFEQRGRWPDVLDEIAKSTSPWIDIVGTDARNKAKVRAIARESPQVKEILDRLASLARVYATDGRRWLEGLRGEAPPDDGMAGAQLVLAMREEFGGALDILEVLGKELSALRRPDASSRQGDEMLVIVRRDGTVEFASEEMAVTLGYELDQFQRLNLIGLLHPGDRQKLRGLLALVPSFAELSAPITVQARQAGGTWLLLRMQVRPLLPGIDHHRFMVRAVMSPA